MLKNISQPTKRIILAILIIILVVLFLPFPSYTNYQPPCPLALPQEGSVPDCPPSKKVLTFQQSLFSQLLAMIIVGNNPTSVTITQEPCDIDRDKDCDKIDKWLFNQSIGNCQDGDNYNELADADHDGCVSENDRLILFP